MPSQSGLGKGMLNWSSKVGLGKGKLSCNNKACHYVIKFFKGQLKFRFAKLNIIIFR